MGKNAGKGIVVLALLSVILCFILGCLSVVSSQPLAYAVDDTENKTDEILDEVHLDIKLIPTRTVKLISKEAQTIHLHLYKLSIKVEATCEKNGYIIYDCSCGIKIQEQINKINHNYVKVSSNADFITYKCSNCGDSYDKKIEKKSAMETDLCGESLIEKILPHAKYSELMTLIFDLYHSHYAEDDYDSKIVLPDGMHYVQAQQSFFGPYRYIGENIHFIGGNSPDGKPTVRVYCKAREDEEAQIVYSEAQKILKQLNIDNTTTQKEAITRINSWLCKQKEYDYAALDDVTRRNSSMFYSLFNKEGVCANYAVAFQILCLSAGIECHYYSSSSMNHAWNKVYFSDGSYRWVDVTWNDNDNPAKWSKYLLITDEQLLKDHTL